MARIKILADGISPQAQANARGKLFERVMAEVLRHNGYTIDTIPSVNYAGMEIDIDGKATIAQVPLYAECKCYETEVDSPKFQAFYGKYMSRWLNDKRSHGLFIALPGINSHAKGFYRENCEKKTEITVKLLEEDDVFSAIISTNLISRPEAIVKTIDPTQGTPGDVVLLYTDKGIFWVVYIIPPSTGIAKRIAVLDHQGNRVIDKATIDYLIRLLPELGDFDLVSPSDASTSPTKGQDAEEIVEVRGSSACFEYQFPASPEYFVGRQAALSELDDFVKEVLQRTTSSRGILFEANSGWGKSSIVLASVERLRNMGHFALAIDSRSASSSQFILRVTDYVLRSCEGYHDLLDESKLPKAISGFDGAVKAILHIGKALEAKSKLLFIFLDQFENVFFLQDALRRIRDLFLKVCDAQTNVVFGFSWKTDLIGLTSEFSTLR